MSITRMINVIRQQDPLDLFVKYPPIIGATIGGVVGTGIGFCEPAQANVIENILSTGVSIMKFGSGGVILGGAFGITWPIWVIAGVASIGKKVTK